MPRFLHITITLLTGRITTIDPYGYHLSNCKIAGGAIRLHDNVVNTLVMLFRSLGLSVALEPLHVFSQIEADDERRPDMLIRNPLGGGPQTVVEVAVSGFNNRNRTNNNKPEQVPICLLYTSPSPRD